MERPVWSYCGRTRPLLYSISFSLWFQPSFWLCTLLIFASDELPVECSPLSEDYKILKQGERPAGHLPWGSPPYLNVMISYSTLPAAANRLYRGQEILNELQSYANDLSIMARDASRHRSPNSVITQRQRRERVEGRGWRIHHGDVANVQPPGPISWICWCGFLRFGCSKFFQHWPLYPPSALQSSLPTKQGAAAEETPFKKENPGAEPGSCGGPMIFCFHLRSHLWVRAARCVRGGTGG